MTTIEKIQSSVVTDPQTGCWLWQLSLTGNGYGQIWHGGCAKRAHRVSYEAFVGPIGKLCVCHTCDVRSCVNPAHLFLGTAADNAHDRDTKGRRLAPHGFMNGCAKLTPDSVRIIRTKAAAGEAKRKLAREFGVNPQTIRDVVRGKSYVFAQPTAQEPT